MMLSMDLNVSNTLTDEWTRGARILLFVWMHHVTFKTLLYINYLLLYSHFICNIPIESSSPLGRVDGLLFPW